MNLTKVIHCEFSPSHEMFNAYPHRTKNIGALNARTALQKCLIQHGLSVKHPIEISDHHHLKKYPNLLVSLSHTSNFGAAIVTDSERYQSIGIDIETPQRSLRPGTQKYFQREDDTLYAPFRQLHQNHGLILWCLKEAAFKAISPLKPLYPQIDPLTLKSIWIRDNQFGLTDDKRPLGHLQLLWHHHAKSSLLVSTAVIDQ